MDGVARVVEQLAGAVMPASALETHVLPARVADYSPAMLDELPPRARCVWAGHGALAGHDGLVSVHPDRRRGPHAPRSRSAAPDTPLHDALLEALGGGGAWFLGALTDRVRQLLPDDASPSQADVSAAVWDLVWAGHVTNDGLAPLRAWLGSGSTAHRTRAADAARPAPAPAARPARRRPAGRRTRGPGRRAAAG